MNRPRSLRFQLISLYVCLLTLVFFCFGGYIYVVFHQLLSRSLEQTLLRRAQQIATTILEELPGKGEVYVAGEIQARYAPELNERVIRIIDADRREIYTSQKVQFLAGGANRVEFVGEDNAQPVYWEETSSQHEKYRFVGLVHRLANGKTYVVEVGAPENGIASALQDLVMTLAIGFPVLIGLSIFGGYSLLGRALRPVDEIVGAAERITFKHRNQRLPVPETGDEFERISEALNRMIERLDESYQIANRFSGDASHELRTPLTIIQGELEALIADPTLSSDAVEHVGNVLEEVARLARIVEGLLLVSRLEAGEAQMRLERVDLGKMASSLGEQLEPLGREKLITFIYEVGDNVIVEGDEIRLRQIVVNLIDNAIKYTPEGGTIILGVSSLGGKARIEVTDTGIGISSEALPQIFERFYRAEEARASRAQGSGLGLTIVRSIAEAHRGKIVVESNENRGTKISVELILAENEIQPGKAKVQLPVSTLLVILGLLAMTSCSREDPASSEADSSQGANNMTVAVSKVVRGDLAKSVELTAEFLPWQQVEVHAKVSGYVQQINVDVGDHAKKGDILAILEVPEIDQELNQAKASILTAQQEVKSIDAEFNETTLMASRINEAATESKGLIAQQDIDNANDTNRSNEAKLAAAKQRVVEAEANAARIQAMVDYAKVTAPFDGVVTRRYADTGALVQAGTVQSGTSSNSDSMPMVSFAQLNILRLEFPVPEADVSYVHSGDTVDVNVLSMGRHFQGQVARFAQKVDMSTRTMLTEVDVQNPDFTFTPGMYATVQLALARQNNVLTVPIQSISVGDKPSVLVVKDNKIERQDISVGLETPDRAEIVSGLDEGDLVVVGSRSSLQIGQPATPKLVENENQ
jgi:heavy metal sensor kinase/RND family efflux transporter MFP subunit